MEQILEVIDRLVIWQMIIAGAVIIYGMLFFVVGRRLAHAEQDINDAEEKLDDLSKRVERLERPGCVMLLLMLFAGSASANEKACVFVQQRAADGVHCSSGTVVHVTDRYSVVLTNRHTVSHGGPVTVMTVDDEPFKVESVKPADGPDLAALVINKRMPAVAVIGETVPAAGSAIEQWGYPSGNRKHKTGRVRGYDGSKVDRDPVFWVAMPIDFGDSGAGQFVDGKMVSVNWGKREGSTEHGSSVGLEAVREFVSKIIREQSK